LALTSSVVIDAPTKAVPSIPSTRPTREQQKSRSHNYEQHLWEVKVYNDNVNTHEWVARCLVMVVAQTEWQAYQTTKLAHQQGEACLGIWEQELAQRYVDGLSQQGLIVDMFPLGDLQ
jgi:ATP-dependent Clp protease adapter protein ClpS